MLANRGEAMRTRKYRIAFAITTVLMFVLITSYGVIKSVEKSKRVFGEYQKEITVKEKIVLDDQSIINRYGKPIILEAGTTGEIYDLIESSGEKLGYRHIKATFHLDEGGIFSVILRYEPESGKESSIPEIDINKINDSQKITSEFIQIYETYHQEVKQTIIKGSVISVIIALAVAAFIWLIRIFMRKDNAVKILVIITICIDVILLHADAIELYISLWI